MNYKSLFIVSTALLLMQCNESRFEERPDAPSEKSEEPVVTKDTVRISKAGSTEYTETDQINQSIDGEREPKDGDDPTYASKNQTGQSNNPDNDNLHESGADGMLDIDDGRLHKPVRCEGDKGIIVRGTDECPINSAAFLQDDGRQTVLGCCLLPATDIFDASLTAVSRRGRCEENEIVVGADGAGIKCRKINTKRYMLSEPQTVCYWGRGQAGSDGSRDCQAIENELQELIGKTGDRDGCVAYPYGAVIVARLGKDCGDQKSAQILFRDSGLPIEVFPK